VISHEIRLILPEATAIGAILERKDRSKKRTDKGKITEEEAMAAE